jgi:hypothetical protein
MRLSMHWIGLDQDFMGAQYAFNAGLHVREWNQAREKMVGTLNGGISIR